MAKRSKLKPASVNTQIMIKPMVRSINDIGTWRSALRSADNGNRNRLYNLYEDLIIDGTLSDAIDKRIEAVKDADIAFKIDDKEPDEIKDIIDSIEFEDLIGEIMLSRFWGVSVDEFSFEPDGTFSFESIPRKHIRPDIKEITINEEDEHGIDYADNPLILQFGKDKDLGLLLRVAPFVIYKRGGFGDWAQFVELFGMPQRIGKYSSMDEASRKALIEAFETAGSAPYLVIPKETEATQTQLSSSGNGALYNDFRQACNEEILITILGQTMTTVDGSSLAQGKVHLAVQEKKHNADKRFVERTLNRLFVPMLEARGYKVHGGKFRFLRKGEETTVAELIQLSEVVDIPAAYVYDRYNIPKPQEGEEIARRQAAPVQVDVSPDNDDANGDEPTNRHIDKSANRHVGFWRRFFGQAPAWCGATFKYPTNLKNDTLTDRIIRQVVDTKGEAYFNAELFQFISENLLKAIDKGFAKGDSRQLSDLNFGYDATDDAFRLAMQMNIFHFSAAKDLAEMQTLNQIFRESHSFAEFYREATKKVDVFNKDWLKTEYGTAVNVCENAQTYRRLWKKRAIFPYWEYKTAGDDKVREEHRTLDGVILPAEDKAWDKIYPPNGWNCRCYVVARLRNALPKEEDERKRFIERQRQIVERYMQTEDWKQVARANFDHNRAVEAEIFSSNQMYIKKFPTMASKLMDKIKPAEWGLRSISTMIAKSINEIVKYAKTGKDFFNETKVVEQGKEVLSFKDYSGMKWTYEAKTFFEHVMKYPERVELLGEIKNVLMHPDEVWLSRQKPYRKAGSRVLNDIVFIRYYKTKPIAVCGKIENGELKLKTWFPLDRAYNRSGILVKK